MGSTEKLIVVLFCAGIISYGGYVSYKHSQEPKKVEEVVVAKKKIPTPPPADVKISKPSSASDFEKRLVILKGEVEELKNRVHKTREQLDNQIADTVAQPKKVIAENKPMGTVGQKLSPTATVKKFFALYKSDEHQKAEEFLQINRDIVDPIEYLIHMHQAIVTFKNVRVRGEKEIGNNIWLVDVSLEMISYESALAAVILQEKSRVRMETLIKMPISALNQVSPPNKNKLEQFVTIRTSIPVWCPDNKPCQVDTCLKDEPHCRKLVNVIGYSLGSGYILADPQTDPLNKTLGSKASANRIAQWVGRGAYCLKLSQKDVNESIAKAMEMYKGTEDGKLYETSSLTKM